MKDFLKKLQKQPESIKKIILWSIVIIVGLGFLILWFYGFQKRVENFEMEELKEGVKLPSFGEEIKELTEPFEVDKEALEKLKKEIEKLGEISQEATKDKIESEE